LDEEETALEALNTETDPARREALLQTAHAASIRVSDARVAWKEKGGGR
ncbi:MAG: hypothetical protein JWQ89_3630, partial [Devosia sp.]|nr:hypothetical protein [Devosia sp.]